MSAKLSAVWAAVLALAGGACVGEAPAADPRTAQISPCGTGKDPSRFGRGSFCTHCADGEVFETQSLTCLGVGPAICRAPSRSELSDIDGSKCSPVWCATWQSASGAPCTAGDFDCVPTGDACQDPPADGNASLASCFAGQSQSAIGKPCFGAGTVVADVNGIVVPQSPEPPQWQLPPPPPVANAKPMDTFDHWAGKTPLPLACTDGYGAPHPCKTYEWACPVGYWTDFVTCTPVSGPPPCPAGFLAASAAAGDAPPLCNAKPTACGAAGPDGFGWIADDGDTVYVSAANTDGPWTGARASPFKSVASALPVAQGKRIAVAAGNYSANLTLTSGKLVGRCAQLVTLTGGDSAQTVAVVGKNAQVAISGVTVSGGLAGIAVTDGATATLDGVRVFKAGTVGVYVSGGGKAELHNVVIDRTVPYSDGSGGVGLMATGKGAVVVHGVRVSRSQSMGVWVADAGSTLTGEDLGVDSTAMESGDPATGDGLVVASGGVVEIDRFAAAANPGLQVFASGANSSITLRRAFIGNAASGGSLGFGVAAKSAAAVTLEDCRLVGNVGVGALVTGPGSQLVLRRCEIANTQPSLSKDLGDGVSAANGAQLLLDSVRISANRSAGLRAYGTGTAVIAAGVLIDNTLPNANSGTLGLGINLAEGASAVLNRCRVSANRSSGVVVQDAGSQLFATDLTVDNTLAEETTGHFGQGMLVLDARASLLRTLLFSNATVSLAVQGPLGAVDATGLAIKSTLPRPSDSKYGAGIQAFNHSQLRLNGSEIAGSYVAGVLLASEASATLVGVHVHDILPQMSDGGQGGGVWVTGKASARLQSCRISDVHAAAVATNGGSLVVAESALWHILQAVGDAQIGKAGLVIGDAIVAVNALQLQVSNTLAGGFARAGLVIDGAVAATPKLAACSLVGGVFGVVRQHQAMIDTQGNWIALASQQRIADGAGLAVPEAPQVIDLTPPQESKPKF